MVVPLCARLMIGAAGFAVLADVAAGSAAATVLPHGFVFLRDVAPTIVQDIRYAGAHNFVGRPIAGYTASECVLTHEAARALAAVQATLDRRGLSLLVWDCYRPGRAVDDVVRWTGNPDTRMKAEFYPHTEKRDLIALGYIASRSSHSHGSTVDVAIAPGSLRAPPHRNPNESMVRCTAAKGERFEDGTIDFGTGYDCFDPRAHIDAREIAAAARANRATLRDVMVRFGFIPYDREWWHFRLADEPFPDRIFDFPIPVCPPEPKQN
jgi:zinc D-Ala-D-Ala dipeptidase